MGSIPDSGSGASAAGCSARFPSSLTATGSLLDWFAAQQPAGLDPFV